ncbi:MAG: metallophosphoesterase [Eubacteriales bacterium]|jgi:predicted MPP superfamily phosphohydrolase
MSFLVKIALVLAIVCFAAAVAGTLVSLRRVTRQYTVATDKIAAGSLRLILISDLHAMRYGKKQEHLLSEIAALKPDLLLFAGDVLAEDKDRAPALELLEALGKSYPCYYVTGNHEYRSGKPDEVRKIVRSYGITVLCGTSVLCDTACGQIRIAGIDDLQEAGLEGALAQAETALNNDDGVFTVFLCHHPELSVRFAKEYGKAFDLALSGHAHGGQWRIPGLINGVFAPHQGIFPKYAGGLYDLGESRTLVVGRGLGKSFPIPRIFNPPELVCIDVTASGGTHKK